MAERWGQSQIDTAKSMWAAGDSARQIGDVIGVSRRAVVGFANRNRDRFPYRVEIGPDGPSKKTSATIRVRRYRAYPKTAAIAPNGKSVRFADMQEGQCKFPVSGEPGPDMRCCGAPTKVLTDRFGNVRNKSWCAYHLDIVTQEPRR